jgi:hypothetical protein
MKWMSPLIKLPLLQMAVPLTVLTLFSFDIWTVFIDPFTVDMPPILPFSFIEFDRLRWSSGLLRRKSFISNWTIDGAYWISAHIFANRIRPLVFVTFMWRCWQWFVRARSNIFNAPPSLTLTLLLVAVRSFLSNLLSLYLHSIFCIYMQMQPLS